MITKFIWDHKIPRVKYTKLIQRREVGGVKLVDLETKNYALKASWIARWSRSAIIDESWIYANLPIKDKRIWEIDISPRDLKYIMTTRIDTSTHILKALA